MAESPYPTYKTRLKETKGRPKVCSVTTTTATAAAFEASPLSSPAPPSCAIQPKALGARESYHVILTSYIPVNTTARRTEGNTRKEAGRKAFNSKREKWNGSIHGVNTATKIGKGMPTSLLCAVKTLYF
jgi:hypothetical protein